MQVSEVDLFKINSSVFDLKGYLSAEGDPVCRRNEGFNNFTCLSMPYPVPE